MRRAATASLLVLLCISATHASSKKIDRSAEVDRVFSKWTASTPGCAVGAAVDGKIEIAKAYGMADLEHGAKNTVDTIFEAGSVSKQFTAAAIVMLAHDGKLSLDDPARKYVPELPDYGVPLTLRHMLTHTSGLRDWGELGTLAGWPRGTITRTDADVLEIVGRQRALNFPPGARWSYSNTGYTLAEIVVSRVSGESLAQFTRRRIFEPLGMTRTSWRDDYTRVVPGRAIAYQQRPDGFHMMMPFENVYGHGGLLTTVGDLLKWNEYLSKPDARDADVIRELQQRSHLDNRRPNSYALGLFVGEYKGTPEVSHSGQTAAYTAFLARYPDRRVSVVVLCNVASGAPADSAHAVADLLAVARSEAPATRPEAPRPPAPPYTLTAAEIAAVTGLYRNALTSRPARIVSDDRGLHFEYGPTLAPVSATRFLIDGNAAEIDARGTIAVSDSYGSIDRYERVTQATPTAEALEPLAGRYESAELASEAVVSIDGTSLVLKLGTNVTPRLGAVYEDVFSDGVLTAAFERDTSGKPLAMRLTTDRVWGLRFGAVPGSASRDRE
jgi:CubicO group peptidase (beta-lactamase class C family)